MIMLDYTFNNLIVRSFVKIGGLFVEQVRALMVMKTGEWQCFKSWNYFMGY